MGTLLTKGKSLKNLKTKYTELTRSSVEVGHFSSQGEHEPSGLKYTALMKIHAAPPESSNIKPRPVLLFLDKDIKTHKFDGILRDFDRNNTPSAIDHLLVNVGGKLVSMERDIFGSSVLAPTLAGNPPLIDTGELRDAVSYKTSKNNTVVTP